MISRPHLILIAARFDADVETMVDKRSKHFILSRLYVSGPGGIKRMGRRGNGNSGACERNREGESIKPILSCVVRVGTGFLQ